MNITYDVRFDVYAAFVDYSWMKKIDKLVAGSIIEGETDEINAVWKGASCARHLPWLMIKNISAFSEGLLNSHKPMPVKVLEKLEKNISGHLEKQNISLLLSDRQALLTEIKRIHDDIIEKKEKLSVKHYKLYEDIIWADFTKIPDFIFSLWMNEINTYTSLYFAYENFFIKTLKILLNIVSLRTTRLSSTLRTLVGGDCANYCWDGNDIEKARLIRHAMVHNGRKITSDLEGYRGDLTLDGDEVVIFPEDTTNLYNLLKSRVESYVRKLKAINRI